MNFSTDDLDPGKNQKDPDPDPGKKELITVKILKCETTGIITRFVCLLTITFL